MIIIVGLPDNDAINHLSKQLSIKLSTTNNQGLKMSYNRWRVVLAKGEAYPDPAAVVYSYFVFDHRKNLFDHINAVYDGDGDVEIYSKEYGYIFPVDHKPYSIFLKNQLTTLRVVGDMLGSNKPAIDENGIIEPRYAL
jgi:phage I-like protein